MDVVGDGGREEGGGGVCLEAEEGGRGLRLGEEEEMEGGDGVDVGGGGGGEFPTCVVKRGSWCVTGEKQRKEAAREGNATSLDGWQRAGGG